jgi:hypothetical protein
MAKLDQTLISNQALKSKLYFKELCKTLLLLPGGVSSRTDFQQSSLRNRWLYNSSKPHYQIFSINLLKNTIFLLLGTVILPTDFSVFLMVLFLSHKSLAFNPDPEILTRNCSSLPILPIRVTSFFKPITDTETMNGLILKSKIHVKIGMFAGDGRTLGDGLQRLRLSIRNCTSVRTTTFVLKYRPIHGSTFANKALPISKEMSNMCTMSERDKSTHRRLWA